VDGHLDSLTPVWETLRRYALEVPFTGCERFHPDALARLQRRRRLSAVARSMRSDPRLRALLVDRYLLAGQQERGMPAFLTVLDHVERGFGRWQPAGGMAALLPVLERRLATRAVQVLLGTRRWTSRSRVGGSPPSTPPPVSGSTPTWWCGAGLRCPQAWPATSDVLPRAATPAARTYLGTRGAGTRPAGGDVPARRPAGADPPWR
jgi:hypothetical protein